MLRALLVVVMVCAACSTGPDELEVDIPVMTSGLLGRPISFSVNDADGTVVASGNSTGQPFRVPIQPGATLLIREDLSSSPTSTYSGSLTFTDLQPGDRVLYDPSVRRLPTSAVTAGPSPHTEAAEPELQAGGTIDATETGGAVATRTVTVRGLPPDASGAMIRQVGWPRGDARMITPTADDVVVDLPVVAGSDSTMTLVVVTTRPGTFGVQRHFFGVSASSEAVTLDLSLYPLPWITEVPQKGGGLDYVRFADSWSSGGPPYSGGSSTRVGPPSLWGGGVPSLGSLTLIGCPNSEGYQQVKEDYKRACAITRPGQVVVKSVAPATLTSSF